MTTDWLISDVPDDIETAVLEDQAVGALTQSRAGDAPLSSPLAVSMNDIVIHDTHKWFGGADIRIDVLAVHGNVVQDQPQSWYSPTTRVFPNVHDGARLNSEGMIVFFGWPRYFLDLFIIASRDKKDAKELGVLLRDRLTSGDAAAAVGDFLSLAAAPQAVLIAAAARAALTIGAIAHELVSAVTTKSVGVYQQSWLEHTHRFGEGRHPPSQGASVRADDLSFWLNVQRDTAQEPS